jgi:uncharacterized membrane protein YjfL (UPF0719 family)
MNPLDIILWAIAALVVFIVAFFIVALIRAMLTPRKPDSEHIIGGRHDK